jgi:calcineurin-like phosphoesterase family protein
MTIAVVGDVHGHLALMYAILGRWQREHARRIDLILQVGDLGAFLPTSVLDSATRKHALRDPEELGFAEFAGDSPPPTPLDPRPPLVFIPGNHEDFDLLDRCERAAPPGDAICPVSSDRRILVLRSGRVHTHTVGEESVRVAGVSGISGAASKRHKRVHLNENEIVALASKGTRAVDLLITHEAPDGLVDRMRHGSGSPLVRLLIESLQPACSFFGHHGRSGEWSIGGTRVFALADCSYDDSDDWQVARDAIAIVTVVADGIDVQYLRDDWLRRATPTSWRRW